MNEFSPLKRVINESVLRDKYQNYLPLFSLYVFILFISRFTCLCWFHSSMILFIILPYIYIQSRLSAIVDAYLYTSEYTYQNCPYLPFFCVVTLAYSLISFIIPRVYSDFFEGLSVFMLCLLLSVSVFSLTLLIESIILYKRLMKLIFLRCGFFALTQRFAIFIKTFIVGTIWYSYLESERSYSAFAFMYKFYKTLHVLYCLYQILETLKLYIKNIKKRYLILNNVKVLDKKICDICRDSYYIEGQDFTIEDDDYPKEPVSIPCCGYCVCWECLNETFRMSVPKCLNPNCNNKDIMPFEFIESANGNVPFPIFAFCF